MKERKNIDNLFQEKFENFEVLPPENAWNNIESKLKENKKKKRIIPFWWMYSGVAALIALGIFFINPNNKSLEEVQNPVVNQESNSDTKSNSKNDFDPQNTAIEETEKIENATDKVVTTISKENNSINNNPAYKNKTTLGTNFNEKSSLSKSVVSIATASNNSKISKTKSTVNAADVVANNYNNTNKSTLPNNSNSDNNFTKNTNSIADKNEALELENKIVFTTDIKSVDDSIKIDSTKIALVEKNALEELLNEKGKKIIAEQKINRWQVTSSLAPIYFSSTNNGSPLDEKLQNNSKSYNTNLSYGVGVNYALNKKLKIRAGVNNLAVDYNTNGIVFFQSNNAARLEHVKTNEKGAVIQIENKADNKLPTLNLNGSEFNKFNSNLNQRIGYIEVPLEMSYRIVDKKFGVDFIGGLSTMFLNENEISIQTNGLNMAIGEANNLNQIHFSGNLGIGVKYEFIKRFEARIEPIFKYQLNTFTNDDGNFKPYVFGIYSGVSFTF